MARFLRMDNYDVRFLSGTDEHGQKVEKSANTAGIAPQEFVDKNAKYFEDLLKKLKITNHDFIRTTEERHKKAAQAFWQCLEEKGYIYLDKYAGWYSVRDEAYYNEDELIDGKAPTGAEVEWVEEESYFFKLSEFQKPLLEFYVKHPEFIAPQSRRNEVLSFVKGGLKDLSISRTTFSWGIPVPGNDKHVMYVWLDALVNYLSAIGYPDEDKYNRNWPADIHIVGKDILRFHAVYWPAFLMAAELEIPTRVFAHGWLTNEGEKISKSLGNVIDPHEVVDKYGLDQIRYYLMREIPFGNDGDFSHERVVTRINSDLANNIGNLAQRTLSIIYKNLDGTIPQYKGFTNTDKTLLTFSFNRAVEVKRQIMVNQSFNKALEAINEIAAQANTYIDEQAPWKLRKTDEQRFKTVMYVLVELIRRIGILLQPFTPDAATKLLDQMNIAQDTRGFLHLSVAHNIKPGHAIQEPEGIFPRMEVDS